MNTEILQKIEAFCAVCERCEQDVLEKLQKMGVETSDCEAIIEKLKADNFLNESRFCGFYARDKFRFNRWGKVKIAYMLSLKKIDKSLINKALDEIDETEYTAVLKDLLASKQRSVKAASNYEKEAKLFKFALSRGFEGEAVKNALKTF